MINLLDHENSLAVPVLRELKEANTIASFSMPVVIVYAIAQACIYFLLDRAQNGLKLVIEPYLLIMGFILHVQWRRVAHVYRDHELERPTWMLVGDCLSFVITFWAIWTLIEGFLHQAKLL